jgi:DNA-binding NtrC family response regulator
VTTAIQSQIRKTIPLKSPHAQSREVLIVEDEVRLREMLCRAIKEMGFVATSAPTGEAALRLVENQTFGIAILDLNLPGMGGIELLQKLRAEYPDLQVIILTGFGDLEAAKRAIHFEIVDFLTKPCALGTLEVALDRARRRALKSSNLDAAEPAEPVMQFSPPPAPPTESMSLEELEQKHILTVLAKNGGNRTQTAAQLGISLRKLYYRLEQYQRDGLIP